MARIRGFGSYLPARVVDNEEIGLLCGANPEWIKQQTGIEQRRWGGSYSRNWSPIWASLPRAIVSRTVVR